MPQTCRSLGSAERHHPGAAEVDVNNLRCVSQLAAKCRRVPQFRLDAFLLESIPGLSPRVLLEGRVQRPGDTQHEGVGTLVPRFNWISLVVHWDRDGLAVFVLERLTVARLSKELVHHPANSGGAELLHPFALEDDGPVVVEAFPEQVNAVLILTFHAVHVTQFHARVEVHQGQAEVLECLPSQLIERKFVKARLHGQHKGRRLRGCPPTFQQFLGGDPGLQHLLRISPGAEHTENEFSITGQ